MTASAHLSLFPSSIEQYFSVSHQGKIHELSTWQKCAIVITAIAGSALFGIGILFSFGLSYYLRKRLVEQLNADSNSSSSFAAKAQHLPLSQTAADRIKYLSIQIDKMQKAKKLMRGSWEAINDRFVPECCIDDRYFVNIDTSNFGYTIPNFSPLLLPKGIYCIHSSFNDNMENLTVSQEYNQMVINEFGEDNIYHLVICLQAASKNVKKIYKHQIELYDGIDISDSVNKKNILAFEESLK